MACYIFSNLFTKDIRQTTFLTMRLRPRCTDVSSVIYQPVAEITAFFRRNDLPKFHLYFLRFLDPLDVYRLSTNLSKSVNELLTGPLELNVVDGIILPNLKMARAEEACSFLDTNGRCTVHAFRPGICRMFPLGRFYENRSFQYFLQIHECPKTDRSKVKIKKWLDTPNLKTYEKYIADWHFFLKDLQEYVMNLAFDSSANSDGTARTISMHVLTQFYLTPYPEDGDFYSEFYKRLEKSRLFTQSIGI